MTGSKPGPLTGLRVVELADEQAEYCGLLLAGLGADLIKVEPPEGSPSRRIGPFYEDQPGPDRSLFFWNYNRGKRSAVCDLSSPSGRERLLQLVISADVVLDSTPRGQLAGQGIDLAAQRIQNPRLIVARMSPFGDVGPWADYKATDLVHLALGGVMSNCGYDPDPGENYDLPPIAPQLWHSYHIAGDQLAVAILAALSYRDQTGKGQDISCAIHEAVAKNTELDVTSWIMRRQPLYRQTCQHAAEVVYRLPTIAQTKDGRWIMVRWQDDVALRRFLDSYGMALDLADLETDAQTLPQTQSLGRPIPGTTIDGKVAPQQAYRTSVVQRFVNAFTFGGFPWREAQDAGLMFAPLRKPHENADDEHWKARETFAEVKHPELDRSFRYVTSRWLSTANAWQVGRRAPLLGEDSAAVFASLPTARPAATVAAPQEQKPRKLSARKKPFALDGVRILDFSWFLASAGATRILTAYGAETIKVEWREHPDTRFGVQAPVGGRSAREAATAPLPGVLDPSMGGQFNNKNPGKRGISLNVRDPRGLEIARKLVAISDVVAEGFSPGVMRRWGLGYDELRAIRPDIIYAQQSGAGQHGTWGRFRAIGPIAQSVTGLSEMSGLPEPAMPAGWGYSYLDWIGAYSFAAAIVAALYHRQRTGEGQWIDASQCEAGLFISGLPVLDWSANGREYVRTGNRSADASVAPHGAYPCRGTDNWVALVCRSDEEWCTFAQITGHREWAADARFVTTANRLRNQDELDREIADWTRARDRYEVMETLQGAGIAAGVCQWAEDRYERDPQLRELDWLVGVTGTKIGRWPLAELPVKLSETPPYIGGAIDRAAPYYGEDNEYVFGEMLGMPVREIRALSEDGVI